ncbi:MAG: hypothetical protein ACOVLJ_04210 [Ilumatobacteraceae bacterium]
MSDMVIYSHAPRSTESSHGASGKENEIGANAAEVEQRTKKIGREVAELSVNGLCGTPAQLITKIGEWKAAGAETIYMQILDLDDLDHLDLIGKEVLPHI